MRSIRRSAPAVLLLLLPVLGACGDDGDDGDGDTDSPETSATATVTLTDATSAATSEPAPAGLPAACDVLTAEDVAAAYGVDFGPAEPGGGVANEGDLSWESDNCDWEAEDLVEVQLALAGPEDYTPAFTCQEPTDIGSTVEPVAGIGDQAWWEVDDAGPLEASLRVCTASAIFQIDLGYEDGVDFEGDPKAQSIALAGVVLGVLGS